MEESEFEQELRRLFRNAHAAGRAEFRESLLARCLAVLRENDAGAELDDSELELLAAAGDVQAAPAPDASHPDGR